VTSGMSQTQASTPEMNAVAGKFEQTNSDLTQTLNALMDKLSDLQTTWVGSGGRAFESVKLQYQQDLQKLNQALATTAEAIKTSGASYESSDSSAASLITKSGGGGVSLPL
jgi:WXG100 family type VII secretion target